MAPERILKWEGGTGLARKWRAPIRLEAPKKNCGRALHFFGFKSTISRFGERFRDGQYSLVSFLFAVLLLTVPPPRAQQFVKVGGARATVLFGVSATAPGAKTELRLTKIQLFELRRFGFTTAHEINHV